MSYQKAIEIKSASRNSKSRFISYLDLGEAHLMVNQSSQSLEVLGIALSILEEKEINANPDYFVIYQFLSESNLSSDIVKSRQFLGQERGLPTVLSPKSPSY